MKYRIHTGDVIEELEQYPDNHFDGCLCDPPYGLEFMGKNWDHGVPGVPYWEELSRVMKPGAMLFAFGGTRTHHRLMVAIENADWELRDTMMWLYAEGWPKGQNISKAMDKHFGEKREVVGKATGHTNKQGDTYGEYAGEYNITNPATEMAEMWDGWNTTLKPSWEPVIVAMNPKDGTFVNNALKWGVSGIYIDGCRINANGEYLGRPKGQEQNAYNRSSYDEPMLGQITDEPSGRWPANLLLSCNCETIEWCDCED